MLSRFSRNDNGFSLPELMVGVAILGTLSLAMMNMLDTQMKSMRFIEDKMATINLKSEVRQRMLDPEICDKTLAGLNIKNLPETLDIRDNKGNIFFSSVVPGSKKYEHLQIENIKIVNKDVPDHIGTGWVNLVLTTKRLRKGAGPKVFRPIETPIRVSVNSTLNILSCDTGRVTALDCGQHPHGKVLTTYDGFCPNRIRKRDMCVGGIWLLYEKTKDPDC